MPAPTPATQPEDRDGLGGGTAPPDAVGTAVPDAAGSPLGPGGPFGPDLPAGPGERPRPDGRAGDREGGGTHRGTPVVETGEAATARPGPGPARSTG
ncbi:hypothetical protein ACFRKE_29965, partial [Kitasatospora indigofera]